MFDKNVATTLGVVAALIGASMAMAAPETPAAAIEAGAAKSAVAGVPLGPGMLYPSVGLEYRHDDNIFLQPSDGKSSGMTVLTPTLDLRALEGGRRYGLLYRAEIGRFSASSADDYEDQRLAAEADLGIAEKGRLRLQAEYLDEHDPRGTAGTQGVPLAVAEPDLWHSTRLGATFGYGAPGAQGRIEAAVTTRTKRYDNHRTLTEPRDLDDTETGVVFFYRLAPLTSALFQVTNTGIDYQTAALDSTERRYLVGLTWQATAKTSGTVKVGRQQKDFDDAARTDFSAASWTAAVTWSPRTYSFLELATNRKADETNGVGDLNDRRDLSLAWTHNWTSFARTRLGAQIVEDKYRGATARDDKTTEYGLNVAYQMRRWLNLSLGYTTAERDSDDNAFDYRRNIYMFTAGASL